MRERSKKTAKIYRQQRVPLIKAMLEREEECAACRHIVTVDDKTNGERHRAETLHEMRKRSSNGSIINPENLLSVCYWANDWIEREPAKARALGLVIREGDPNWEALSKRMDNE